MIFWCVNIFLVIKYCIVDEKLKYLNLKILFKKIDIFKGIKCINFIILISICVIMNLVNWIGLVIMMYILVIIVNV